MGSLDNTDPAVSSFDGFNPLDLNDFYKQAHQTVNFICDYYKNIETYPVLPQVQPGFLGNLLPKTPPYHPESFDTILKDFRSNILPGMTHWASPNFFAYFPATLSSAALSADLLASALNPVAFNWLASPAVTELEILSLDWLAQLLHLPKCFHFSGSGGGVLQTTTSETMLCTLVAARDRALKQVGYQNVGKLTAYASDQTHSTFFKACRIVGILPTNIRSVKTFPDNDFALSPSLLRRQMESDVADGLIPIYVCATVGSTSSTAVDPLGPIADVAREHGAWVHVDAAYAGSACICPEFRHHLAGVERVDSLSLSPHKWLLTGLDCCCLWVRDKALFTTSLGTNPEFLRNEPSESGSVVDFKDWQLGVGRRFRGLRLYFVIRCYGVENLQSHIRSDVRMARAFEGLVVSDLRFEMVVPRRFSLVCFRLRPRGEVGLGEEETEALNKRLLQSINGSGKLYMTHTVLGGVYVLRFAVGATLTEERHVLGAWKLIKEKADELLTARSRNSVMDISTTCVKVVAPGYLPPTCSNIGM